MAPVLQEPNWVGTGRFYRSGRKSNVIKSELIFQKMDYANTQWLTEMKCKTIDKIKERMLTECKKRARIFEPSFLFKDERFPPNKPGQQMTVKQSDLLTHSFRISVLQGLVWFKRVFAFNNLNTSHIQREAADFIVLRYNSFWQAFLHKV